MKPIAKIDKIDTISKKLREENRTNDYFEIMLGNLTLEEIIALKMEISYRAIGFPIYGFPIWGAMDFIIKNAMLKFAYASSGSKTRMKRMLGINLKSLLFNIEKYEMKKYFSKEKEKDVTN